MTDYDGAADDTTIEQLEKDVARLQAGLWEIVTRVTLKEDRADVLAQIAKDHLRLAEE